MNTIIVILFLVSIAIYIWAVINIDKNDPNRLLWFILMFFTPILGPLAYLAYYLKKQNKI